MPPTFDGDNLIMTLPAPVDGVLQLDTETDWYSEWKKWSLLDDNLRYEPAFDIVISQETTPGIETGAYFFFRNDLGWRCRPYEADATIYLNGNLTPRVSTLPIMIPTIGAYTVLVDGLQPITQNVDQILAAVTQISIASDYGGQVHIDVDNGEPGTEHPIGTERRPSNNEADAYAIAIANEISAYCIRGTCVLMRDYTGWGFSGHGGLKTDVVYNPAGFDTTSARFETITIVGAFSGTAMFADKCILANVSGWSGVVLGCGFSQNITMGQAGSYILGKDCTFMDTIANPTTFDMVGPGREFSMSASGGAKFINMQSGAPSDSTISLLMTTGLAVFDATCTGGAATISGTGLPIIDGGAQAAGMTLNDNMQSNEAIANAVLDELA